MLYFEGNYIFFYVIYHTYINKERRKYIARCFANPLRLETDQTQDFINVNIKTFKPGNTYYQVSLAR